MATQATTQPLPVSPSMLAYIRALQRQPALFKGDLASGQVHLTPGAERVLRVLHALVSNNDEDGAKKLDDMLVAAMTETRAIRAAGGDAEFP